MLPITVSVSLTAASANNIAQSQTPGAAGALTLNGAAVTNGVAVLATVGTPVERQVLVTTAANESGKTLTITGTNAGGSVITETMTGPNASTGATVQFFQTVTAVTVSAAFAGAVTVGTNGVGGSRPIFLDQFVSGLVAIQTDVTSGTANYTVQQTVDSINTVGAANAVWFDHPVIAAATASAQSNYAYAPQFTRLKINSGTGTVRYTVYQSKGA